MAKYLTKKQSVEDHGIETENTCEVQQDDIESSDLKRSLKRKTRRFSKEIREWFQSSSQIKDGNGELVKNYISKVNGRCCQYQSCSQYSLILDI